MIFRLLKGSTERWQVQHNSKLLALKVYILLKYERIVNEQVLFIYLSVGYVQTCAPSILASTIIYFIFSHIVKKVKIRKINWNHIFVRVNILHYIINNIIENQISNCTDFLNPQFRPKNLKSQIRSNKIPQKNIFD